MKKIKKALSIFLTVISLFCITFNTVEVNSANIPLIEMNDTGTDLKSGNIDGTDYGIGSSNTHVFNKVLTEYRGIVVFISGIALISMIMFFIFNFIELGNSKGNPQARQKAINGLIISGIATAGLGSVNLIVQLFYNMISADE